MSATAEIEKLSDYFGDYYGHSYNRAAPLVSVKKPSNYSIDVLYLDDLYLMIPAVSIIMLYAV